MNDLLELLKIESEEIATKFRKASLEGKGTSQEVSDRREDALQQLVQKYFPFPFKIGKGNIIDSSGGRSASIDCVVLNPDHPHTIGDGKHYSVLLADGVDFAIELKPDLVSDAEIWRAAKQVASVKLLSRVSSEFAGEKNEKIPCLIFSNSTYTDLNLTLKYFAEYYASNKIKREHQFDMLVINGRCLVINYRKNSIFGSTGNTPEGFVIVDSKENTLAGMIWYMSTLPLSSVRIQKAVLSSYIQASDLGPLSVSPTANAYLDLAESSE